MKKKANKSDTNNAASKKIKVSNYFEDAENSQFDYWAGLSPEQRFADFLDLMKRFYTFEKPEWSTKRINFDM